jgi:hypothetical protein
MILLEQKAVYHLEENLSVCSYRALELALRVIATPAWATPLVTAVPAR